MPTRPSAMSAPAEVKASAARVCALIKKQVRRDFPYMRTSTLETIARCCAAGVKHLITEQLPEMEETKARVNFMTLSAELRNRIYELVITPQKDGEGGGKASRAICVQETCVVGYNSKDEKTLKSHGTIVERWKSQPAITRVSREVRAETLPMYYGLNEFLAYCGDPVKDNDYDSTRMFYDIDCWLSSIEPANAALIKHFKVLVPMDHGDNMDEVMDALSQATHGMDKKAITVRQGCGECPRWHDYEPESDWFD